ncbi:MAG: hypothetical protein AAF226_17380, partial [Verrucomicrobiota bacterium]
MARNLRMDLGDIVNTDTDNSLEEVIRVTYETVVLNATENNHDDTEDNRVDFSWENFEGEREFVRASAPTLTVVEPLLSLEKTVLDADGNRLEVANVTLGSTVTFEFTIEATRGEAFNAEFFDRLPPGITIDTESFEVDTNLTSGVPDPDIVEITTEAIYLQWTEDEVADSASADFSEGDSFTFRVSGTVQSWMEGGDIVTNEGRIEWTSIPGEPGQISELNKFSTERTGDLYGPGEDGANDHFDDDLAHIFVVQPTFSKEIGELGLDGSVGLHGIDGVDATSETHTSGTQLTIGETVSYILTTEFQAGKLDGVIITDQLPVLDGTMEYVNTQIRIGENVTTANLDLTNPALFDTTTRLVTAAGVQELITNGHVTLSDTNADGIIDNAEKGCQSSTSAIALQTFSIADCE